MPIENATYINGLNGGLPGATDVIAEGDDHIRLIKNVLLNTFPNLGAAVNASANELNQLVGTVITAYAKTLLSAANSAAARSLLEIVSLPAPGPSGNILRSDGTNWVSHPSTYFGNHVQQLNTHYTVALADAGKLFITYTTITINLPSAATLGNGFVIGVRNSGPGVITIDPFGAEYIDLLPTHKIFPGQSCVIVCDGTQFFTVGRQPDTGKVNVQFFYGNGTWNKPYVGMMAVVECWGGGGSGSSGSSTMFGGGGGGNYVCYIRPLFEFVDSIPVTVGMGGAGTTGPTGNDGGNTTFGTYVTAHGGKGGTQGAGGGGGAAGSTEVSQGRYGGGNGGDCVLLPFGTNGSSICLPATGSTYGGGGGCGRRPHPDGGPAYPIPPFSGGSSMYGGGGGGHMDISGCTGGTSLYGGNGGGFGGNKDGAFRGGGGAAVTSGVSGAGGNGFCRVIVF